jgi:exosortase
MRSTLLSRLFLSGKDPGNPKQLRIVVLGIALGIMMLLLPLVKALLVFGIQDDRYLEVAAAPVIALFLIYSGRRDIFSVAQYSPRLGVPLFSLAILVCVMVAVRSPRADEITALAPVAFSAVLLWQTTFFLCYGHESVKRAVYPLCSLFLMIPLPANVLDALTNVYREGSAAVTYFLLNLFGVSVLRNGSLFSIPGLDINISPECSGIHSGVAFLLVGLLASRLFLKSTWTRLTLILATLPIAIFKNAVRISVTTSLGAFVDRSFIDGPFHHQYGGIVFAPLDLLLFLPALIVLKKLETRPFQHPAVTPSTSTVLD